MHLRMTGTCARLRRGRRAAATCACGSTLDTGSGCCVRPAALRHRRACCSGGARSTAYFAARLGVEPLGAGLHGEALRELARGRRAPVKAFLLDQERVAGVGNIYADEALFRARIHPLRPVGAAARARSSRRCATRSSTSLRPASTPRAPRSTTSATPTAPRQLPGPLPVHRREGEPCPRCGAQIGKMRRGRPRHLRVRALPAAAAARPAIGRPRGRGGRRGCRLGRPRAAP